MKDLIAVIADAPYAGTKALETLEAAMVAAAFDFSTSVLFRGAGVAALSPDQNGSVLGTRTVGKVVGALASYEISNVYICNDGLQALGLAADDLVIDAQPLSTGEQAHLLARHAVVLGA